MNRIDRLSAILIQLQSRRLVKAQDIADRFTISLRTVYRDIKALEASGVPIIGEAGQGYSLMEGYRLPPVSFTHEEAMAFLTAEKMMDKLADAGVKDAFRSSMYKIRAVLRTAEKDLLENIEGGIEVLRMKELPTINPDLRIQSTVLTSLASRKAVNMQYFSHYKREATSRIIEPLGLFYMAGYWHLIAYCQMRKDYRDFRLDRISGLSLTDTPFTKTHISLQEYLKKEQSSQPLTPITIRIHKQYLHYLGDQKYYMGLVSEKECGDEFELSFMTPSCMGFVRWVIMFGDLATIVTPVELRNEIRELAASILQRNG